MPNVWKRRAAGLIGLKDYHRKATTSPDSVLILYNEPSSYHERALTTEGNIGD